MWKLCINIQMELPDTYPSVSGYTQYDIFLQHSAFCLRNPHSLVSLQFEPFCCCVVLYCMTLAQFTSLLLLTDAWVVSSLC